MSEYIYLVNWSRSYSEYGYCYITKSKEDAYDVAGKLTKAYERDLMGVEFTVSEERVGYVKEIWD